MALRRPSSAPATRTPTKAPRSLSAKLLRAHSNSEFDEKRLRRLLKKKLKQHEQEAKSLREAAAAEGREAHMPFQLVADPASPYGMRCSFDGPASAKKHGFDDWAPASPRGSALEPLTPGAEPAPRPASAPAGAGRRRSRSREAAEPAEPLDEQAAPRESAPALSRDEQRRRAKRERDAHPATLGKSASAGDFGARKAEQARLRRSEREAQAAAEARARDARRVAKIERDAACRLWLGLVPRAAVGLALERGLRRHRAREAAAAERLKSAMTIQKARRGRVARDLIYYSARLARAAGQNMRLLLQIRIQRKRRALRRVAWFFAATERFRRFKHASARIHRSARAMQRGVRDFAACTTARVAVLRLLWLRCEDEHGALTKKKKKRKPRSKRKEDGEEEHYVGARQLLRDDDAWDKVSERMDVVRDRLVRKGVLKAPSSGHLDPALVRDVAGAALAHADPQREEQIVILLRDLRAEHRARWSEEARRAHHAASRTYSGTEAFRLLALDDIHRRASALVPQDPGLRKWPLMAFFRPPGFARSFLGDGDSRPPRWRHHDSLKGRVYDVLLAYRAAEAFEEHSKDYRRASTRASLIANAIDMERAKRALGSIHFRDAPVDRGGTQAKKKVAFVEEPARTRGHGTLAAYKGKLGNSVGPSLVQ
ncbi:hypothetical protein SO694_00023481 [Aureococcus anophagefferens]|uniref:Uncharacterized protein n=1 Tax=Aureococcus anophagefferens TaxID=44056 RepID=A0ABR1FTM4_AURAN